MRCIIKKVLFIGNSHTFFESLPFLFAEVCRQSGIEVHIGMCTHPGCDLQWHLASSCTMPNLRYGKYDFVIIQQKAHPFDGADVLIEQGAKLIREIHNTGAKAVIFSVWSEKNNPGGQAVVDKAHQNLYEMFDDILIARCGTAWHSLRDSMDLYAADGEHQNSRGAYLNACVIAKTIFGIDPLALPDAIDFKGLSMPLTGEELRILQKAVK